MSNEAFVARTDELAALNRFLAQTLGGNGQVCLIAGEAGTGKTALVTEFVQRAQREHQTLVAAIGDCNDQSGMGTPYLPFKEILNLLTGNVGEEIAPEMVSAENADRLRTFLGYSGKALIEYGPELIDIFVPGAALVGNIASRLSKSGGNDGWKERLKALVDDPPQRDESPLGSFSGLDQSQIFEQYTNVLRAAAAAQPIVLMIDDLQWADAGSLNLFFHLARRIDQSAILLIGAYRPAEVALGRNGERHPLEKILAEIKRYQGDVTIDTDTADVDLAAAIVDRVPNRYSSRFKQRFARHTSGHALFCVELDRSLKEEGYLQQDGDGVWFEADEIDWATVPARVEGILEERFGRLSDEEREALSSAGIQGEEFVAEVLAAILDQNEREVVRLLSGDLEKRHRLIGAVGRARIGRQRISRYHFEQHVYQRYVYYLLDEIERSYLHEDAGLALESLYGDQAEEIAVQLAWHFVNADLPDKALPYLRAAARLSAAAYANDEALLHVADGLALLDDAGLDPDDEDRARAELLQIQEQICDRMGKRPEQAAALDELEALADGLGDGALATDTSLRRAALLTEIGAYADALAVAERALAEADEIGDSAVRVRLIAQGTYLRSRILWHANELAAAAQAAETARAMASDAELPAVDLAATQILGLVASDRGQFAAAEEHFRRALALAENANDTEEEAWSWSNLGLSAWSAGDTAGAADAFARARELAVRAGNQSAESSALTNLGALAASGNRFDEARRYLEQAHRIQGQIEQLAEAALVTENLAGIAMELGDTDAAETLYAGARARYRELDDRVGCALVDANRAVLLSETGDTDAAVKCGEQAVAALTELDYQDFLGTALTNLGLALLAAGQAQAASDRLDQAVALQTALGQEASALESKSGLAAAWLAQGSLDAACATAAQVLDALAVLDAPEFERPERVYWHCYLVFSQSDDPRAQSVLADGYQALRAATQQIKDPELQQRYLRATATRRALADTYFKSQ